MANIFEKDLSVPIEAIEIFIGCKSEAFTMNDLIRLKKVHRSLSDGMAKREDYFDLALPAEEKAEAEVRNPFENKQEVKEDADGQQLLQFGSES